MNYSTAVFNVGWQTYNLVRLREWCEECWELERRERGRAALDRGTA